MTIIEKQPGAGTRHVAYRPPITDGLTLWHLLGRDADQSKINRALGDATLGKATVIGDPVWQEGYGQFSGAEVSLAALRSPLFGTPQFTLMAIVYVPETVTSNQWPTYVNTSSGGSQLLGWILSTSTTTRNVSMILSTTNGSLYATESVQIAAVAAGWHLFMVKVSATDSRIWNLSTGTVSASNPFAGGYAHVPSVNRITIGAYAGATAGIYSAFYNGPASVAHVMYANRANLTNDEISAMATKMIALSRARDVPVPEEFAIAA